MSRAYWTIYDDDTREFEQELEQDDEMFDATIQVILRRMMAKEGKLNHFKDQEDLFEV
jgi:predicted transcriptional regulator